SRAVVVARSRLSCTRESVVLTPCPPGPEARENCSPSSDAGTVRPSGAPGPAGTNRSFTPSSLPHRPRRGGAVSSRYARLGAMSSPPKSLRVVLTALGSEGDVAPVVAIGRALAERG